MFRANYLRCKGKPKPEVIAELMTIPVFSAPYDERHIARLYQKFQEEETARRKAFRL
jgi:hypothetical protein